MENFEQSASPSYLRPSYLLLSTIHLPRVNVSANHHSKYRRRALLMSRGKKRSSAHQCCYGSLVFGSQGRWHPRTGMAKDPIRCARRQGWRGGVVGPLAFLSVLQPHARQYLGALGMHMKACKQRPAEEDDRCEALFKDYEQRRWAKPRRRLAAPRVGASLGASQESYKKATSRRPW